MHVGLARTLLQSANLSTQTVARGENGVQHEGVGVQKNNESAAPVAPLASLAIMPSPLM